MKSLSQEYAVSYIAINNQSYFPERKYFSENLVYLFSGKLKNLDVAQLLLDKRITKKFLNDRVI